jgi:hypothetical protein
MSESKRPTTVEQFGAKHLDSAISKIVDRLRDLANEVDRIRPGIGKVGSQGRPSYANIAAEVQHSVLWAMANLSLGELTATAVTADTARQRGLAAKTIAEQIEAIVGGYPDNEVERPKVERGEHLNDREWAASIAREYAAKEA